MKNKLTYTLLTFFLFNFILTILFKILFYFFIQFKKWDNQASNVIFVCICYELQHSISSVSICYAPQSDIRVKCYGRLYLLRASTFNFERLDMLRDSIRHSREKLLSFELAQRFSIQFRASRYITGLNQTSE